MSVIYYLLKDLVKHEGYKEALERQHSILQIHFINIHYKITVDLIG